jgi:hypothetical protein
MKINGITGVLLLALPAAAQYAVHRNGDVIQLGYEFANLPPTIAKIPNRVTVQNVIPANIAFSIGDPETPPGRRQR